MKQPFSRRAFLTSKLPAALAAVAFPAIVPAPALGRGGATAASERTTVAVVGLGPQGTTDFWGVLAQKEAQVVAVCDVHEPHLSKARWKANRTNWSFGCAAGKDFRKVVSRTDVDAVLIATPDHWHAPIALAALEAGKDVYLEKPIGIRFAESQALRAAVHAKKRVFQFGTQQRSSREFQRAVELVRNGRIGKLREIHVWAPASRPGGGTEPAPVPPGLDYDFWLGPAPKATHTAGRCLADDERGIWKTWWFSGDYSIGFIAGWGIHPMDIALWAHPAMMNGPIEIEGRCGVPDKGACNTAVAWDVRFGFADGVQLRFRGTPNRYDERSALTDFSDYESRFGAVQGHGTAFVGTEGWIEVHRGGLRSSPASIAEGPYEGGAFKVRASEHHQRDWLDAIRSREQPASPIDESVHADLLCHLADIAGRLGRKLRFDPKTERFIGDLEADGRLAMRPARDGWKQG